MAAKLDVSDDRAFYAAPRFVKHADDAFLAQVTQLYRERIPPGGDVFDMCSSFVSHLPPEVSYNRVVGHGMNAAELAANPRLDSFFVRNLNVDRDPFPQEENAFDAVTCCVSIQYMQHPEEVLAEVFRILRPGGCVIITFSNRLFYQKAVAAWRDGTGFSRCQLVSSYLRSVVGYTEPEVLLEVPLPEDRLPDALANAPAPLQEAYRTLASSLAEFPPAVALRRLVARSSSDPFYAVVAYKNFRRVDVDE